MTTELIVFRGKAELLSVCGPRDKTSWLPFFFNNPTFRFCTCLLSKLEKNLSDTMTALFVLLVTEYI